MERKFLTLNQNKDFRRVYGKGKSFISPCLVCYILPSKNGSTTRIGITVSKKIGNAVTRNRAKRVIRAAIQEIAGEKISPCDIVLVARSKTPYVKSGEVAKQLHRLLYSNGVLTDAAKNELKV